MLVLGYLNINFPGKLPGGFLFSSDVNHAIGRFLENVENLKFIECRYWDARTHLHSTCTGLALAVHHHIVDGTELHCE
jgi:hypothetical protein